VLRPFAIRLVEHLDVLEKRVGLHLGPISHRRRRFRRRSRRGRISSSTRK
jgi:hypothetical protein